MFYYPYIFPVPFPGYGIPFPPYGWLWPGWQTERSTQKFWWRYLAAKRRRAAAASTSPDTGTAAGTGDGIAEAAAFAGPDEAPVVTARRKRAAQ